MEHESEHLLTTSLASLSKGRQKLFAHIGFWIAALSLLVAALVTFTDISLLSITTQSFTVTMAVYVTVTVLMYLSLEEEGERTGRSEKNYKDAEAALLKTAALISPARFSRLERFCCNYAKEEFAERRARLLLVHGISDENPEQAPPAVRRKLERLRPLQISAFMLLGSSLKEGDSPLCNPEKRRRNRRLTRLLPSLICMTFGIGIAIGAHDSLTTSAILEGVFKLSALLIIGLRGYTQGYLFTSEAEIPFLRAKTRLLERFLYEDEEQNPQKSPIDFATSV